MFHARKALLSFVCLSTLCATSNSTAQAPALTASFPFNVPMTDGTTSQAVILPKNDGSAYLVISSPTGQLGLFLLTPQTTPPPTPNPTPPPPPPTPPPPSGTAAAFITITAAVPAAIPAETQALFTSRNITYYAYTASMVSDPQPPPNSLTWIGACAGKQLPYSFLATADGQCLWQGPTPTTAADFAALLPPASLSAPPAITCPSGTCPLQRNRSR